MELIKVVDLSNLDLTKKEGKSKRKSNEIKAEGAIENEFYDINIFQLKPQIKEINLISKNINFFKMNFSEDKIEEIRKKRKWKKIAENLNDKNLEKEEGDEEGLLLISLHIKKKNKIIFYKHSRIFCFIFHRYIFI